MLITLNSVAVQVAEGYVKAMMTTVTVTDSLLHGMRIQEQRAITITNSDDFGTTDRKIDATASAAKVTNDAPTLSNNNQTSSSNELRSEGDQLLCHGRWVQQRSCG